MELHATLGAGVHMGECWGSFVPVVALRRGLPGEFCTAPVCGAVRGRDMSAPRPAFDLHPARAAGHPAQWAHSPGCDSPLPLAGEGEVHEEQVEGDDDGRDEETCDTQGAIVDVVAHDLTVCGQAHEWDDREGDAE